MQASKLPAIAVVLLLVLVASSSALPNFIVFLADDVGYGDLGYTGHPSILTPNLDRLAAEGMRFTQFYAGAPICSPSRSALVTGRLPIRNGVYTQSGFPLDNLFRVFYPWSVGSLPETEITIPELLHDAGYRSGIVGKWHLGHVNALPTERGFDSFFGLPYSQDEGCPPGVGFACEEGVEGLFPPTPLYRNLTIEEQPVDLYDLVPKYNAEAMAFIEESHAQEQPFFLYMAYDEAHIPLFASPAFQNTSLRGLYGDAVQEMDASVGTIVQTLVDLGIDDNTLVFFASDNGPWQEQELSGGSTGCLRGGKGDTWEGGVRSPTIAWWPNHIEAGSVNMDIGSMMDFLPTFCELAGVSLPTDRIYDGVSLVPALQESGPIPRHCYFYYRQHDLQAVRCGAFKAHYMTRCAYCNEPPTYHTPPILYNVEQDLEEYWPLNHTEYEDVLAEIEAAKVAHEAALVKGEPQLDRQNPLVAPCCDEETHCTCAPGSAMQPASLLPPDHFRILKVE